MIDALMQSLLDDGWLFNNCYQTDEGIWRVNIRRGTRGGDFFTEWAEALTFAGALALCIQNIETAEFAPERKVKVTELSYSYIDKTIVPRRKPTLEDLV